MPADTTPMMRQYLAIKNKYPNCILFFRLGDFYEMFNEDAKLVSKELDLTLTTRDRNVENPDERTPMCGVPYHSYESYVAKLIAKGYKVAICEQIEDPALAKGIVERDVVRIITPGTLMESSMLEEGRSNYIAAVYCGSEGCAVSFAEVSTGEFMATVFPAGSIDKLCDELARYQPAEIIMNGAAAEYEELLRFIRLRIGCMYHAEDARFDYMSATLSLCTQFCVRSTDELGIGDENSVTCAAGGLISYLMDAQRGDMRQINKLNFYTEGRYMELDVQTLHNLELVQSMRSGEKKGSLLWVLDRTRTPMGLRLLRTWLTRPLLSPAAIRRRQEAVSELVNDGVCRSECMQILRSVGDMERLISKVVYGTANCRDLAALASSLGQLPLLKAQLEGASATLLREIGGMDAAEDVRDMIDAFVGDDPPFSVREGGFTRPGYNAEVDELRYLLTNSNEALADIEAREKTRTGKKLRLGYNRVFGYYIEIPRSMSEDVPEDYIRKQTLVNCERFITQELKELETKLFNARDRLNELEYELFSAVRAAAAQQVERVQKAAALAAQADVLCSLAEVAVKNNYCLPTIDIGQALEIRDGRHPVVEVSQNDSLFVPNDVLLDGEECRAAIITGPNMAGKSTYMRQTALIVLMAQIGSFVPASYAHVGVVDRVFTRIGASDDLAGGMSTFMVEMSEVADILKYATARSLIILDEIGRGTSTYDGMAIARAVLEHCADRKKLGAKTLFATHYHELTVLEGELNGVKNFNITAKKRGGDLIFLRKIVPGGADESYGIEVANLAGIPESVIRRAREALKEAEGGSVSPHRAAAIEDDDQISMADISALEIAEAVRRADPNTMTPLEALNFIYELKRNDRA